MKITESFLSVALGTAFVDRPTAYVARAGAGGASDADVPRRSWSTAFRAPVRMMLEAAGGDPGHNDVVTALPGVLSEFELSNAFLGKIVEVCVVTGDHERTMAGLVRLGIGPFRVYTFDDETLAAPTYRGQSSPFALKVCFAQNAGLTWEIMQPLSGRTVVQEFLDAHGEGIHHVAFDCNDAPWQQRLEDFERRGFAASQSGRWQNQNTFSFFDTEAATTTCFETYHFPEGFVFPEPERWYPGPPPSAATQQVDVAPPLATPTARKAADGQ